MEGTTEERYVEYVHGYPPGLVRPPRTRHTARNILVSLLAVFGLCCIGGVALAISLNGGWGGKSSLGPAPPGLNTPVRDGQFTFVVSSVTCGQATVGRSIATRRAQGTFCLVKLTISNTGTEAQSFSDVFQRLLGSDGASYQADTVSGLVANENLTSLWSRIKPGDTVTATVVYDVPKETTIAKVELHDSPLSEGTLVTL